MPSQTRCELKKVGWLSIFVTAALLTFAVRTNAQQPKTVFRMGYLSSFDPVTDPRIEGIRQSLREFGYIEGQNITITYRNTEGKLDRYAEFAAELVRLKVDIIVLSGGNQQIRVAMNATTLLLTKTSLPSQDPAPRT